ncbi:MAG TPA: hypothetical protein VKB93_19680 [Thermoanaerobaculia bacterium]|nr:hypothetical protein [Thermoanaerobaculia bacterium]
MTTVPETPLSHTERARLVLEHIRGIKELIGGFTFGGAPDSRTLNFVKSVPDEFLEATAVALEASEDLAKIDRISATELREVVAFALAFTPVADELAYMHRAVQYTIALRRADAGQRSLQVYQMGKTITRKMAVPGSQVLIPHMEAMKRTLGKARPKSTPPAPPAVKQGGGNA